MVSPGSTELTSISDPFAIETVRYLPVDVPGCCATPLIVPSAMVVAVGRAPEPRITRNFCATPSRSVREGSAMLLTFALSAAMTEGSMLSGITQ